MTKAPPTEKPARRKGKALAKMSRATLDTIVLSLVMELRDDATLLRMRIDQVLAALDTREEKP